jgi:membrane protein YdbS with pleckstrin-like domain
MLQDSEEQVYIDARRHCIVLVRPLARACILAVIGSVGFLIGWPASAAGAVLLLVAAGGAVAAVWGWDRTHVVVTTEKLFVVHGFLRRRAAAVRLAKVSTVELEQSILGRLLGYGTVVAGDLEIRCVPRPRELCGLVQRLAG